MRQGMAVRHVEGAVHHEEVAVGVQHAQHAAAHAHVVEPVQRLGHRHDTVAAVVAHEAVARFVEGVQGQTLGTRAPARGSQERSGPVHQRHLGAPPRELQRQVAGAAGQVEHAAARTQAGRGDDVFADLGGKRSVRQIGLDDALVVA
jgi:hypothetical protein